MSLRCLVFLYEEQQVLRCARIGIYSLIDFAGRLNEILLIMFIVLDVGNWINCCVDSLHKQKATETYIECIHLIGFN